ncbi:MAG: hypothetical protein M1840_007458 [Geoglossum simile]|nr:MAG: hypothetical protein M1840_007458 [Geoglossum simile]
MNNLAMNIKANEFQRRIKEIKCFIVGRGDTIESLDTEIQYMSLGGIARLTVPSNLAFGKELNVDVIVEVILKGINKEDDMDKNKDNMDEAKDDMDKDDMNKDKDIIDEAEDDMDEDNMDEDKDNMN